MAHAITVSRPADRTLGDVIDAQLLRDFGHYLSLHVTNDCHVVLSHVLCDFANHFLNIFNVAIDALLLHTRDAMRTTSTTHKNFDEYTPGAHTSG